MLKNRMERNIPAAYLAFLTRSEKARRKRFVSSANVTPALNRDLASMVAIIISCIMGNGVGLNDTLNTQ